MKALDGQVPDGVQIMVDTSVGKQIDAGVVGGPTRTSGGGLGAGRQDAGESVGLGLR